MHISELFKRRKPARPEDTDWSRLLKSMIDEGIVTEKEVAEVVLGALNCPQFGTSIASNPVYQKQYPPRKTFAAALDWAQSQKGQCFDCGTRLNLEIDHILPRKEGGKDELSNHTLRCRRCNTARRHAKGRITELTTQAALTYVLLERKPSTYKEYERECRDYGLTCSSIRIKEGWVLNTWLKGTSTVVRPDPWWKSLGLRG